MEGTELIAFKIIAAAGTARSCYISAIQEAKAANWEKVSPLLQQGDTAFNQAHEAHASLLTEAANETISLDLLLVHTEDQLMSAENFKILANEFTDLYRIIHEK